VLLKDDDFILMGKMPYCALSPNSSEWGEDELVHVYALVSRWLPRQITANPEEIDETQWIVLPYSKAELADNYKEYSPWFKA
jgi:isopentenyldiphosphate isomerase